MERIFGEAVARRRQFQFSAPHVPKSVAWYWLIAIRKEHNLCYDCWEVIPHGHRSVILCESCLTARKGAIL
jgi:predicted amidophosphoribosyltransferase